MTMYPQDARVYVVTLAFGLGHAPKAKDLEKIIRDGFPSPSWVCGVTVEYGRDDTPSRRVRTTVKRAPK